VLTADLFSLYVVPSYIHLFSPLATSVFIKFSVSVVDIKPVAAAAGRCHLHGLEPEAIYW